MTLNQESSVFILKYKVLFEELDQVESELSEGTNELSFLLSQFRRRLTDIKNQDKRFDSLFFKNEASEELIKTEDKNVNSSSPDLKKHKHPIWAKKLYKDIVSITHPDKTSGLTKSTLTKKLTNQYMLTIESYKKSKYEDLLMVGYDLDCKINQTAVKEIIEPALTEKATMIVEKKKLLGYQWYHVPEDEKEEKLTQYLINLGFVFTKEKVSEAIKNRHEKFERPVGVKPKKIRR